MSAPPFVHKHSAYYGKRRTQTKHRPSLKAGHKMLPVRLQKFKMADSWLRTHRVCVRACVPLYVLVRTERPIVLCWLAGSVPATDPYRCQIKTALFGGRETVRGWRGFKPAPPRVQPSWSSAKTRRTLPERRSDNQRGGL